MKSSIEAVRWAWYRIDQILQEWKYNEAIWQDHVAEVIAQLTRSLKSGSLVISALEKDLGPWTNSSEQTHFGFGKKAKVIWNERILKDHQDRIRDQVNSMNLLISVMQMPKAVVRKQALHDGQKVFRKSDQSASSIIPSRLSRSMWCRESVLDFEREAPLVHHELSIDSELFTAHVYKRNYRNSIVRNLLRRAQRPHPEPQEVSSSSSTDSAKFAEGPARQSDSVPHHNSNSVIDNISSQTPAVAVNARALTATPLTPTVSFDASKTHEADPAGYVKEVVSVSRYRGISTSLSSGSSFFANKNLPPTPHDPDHSISSSWTYLSEDPVWIRPTWKVGDISRAKVRGPQLTDGLARTYFYSWYSWKTMEEWCVSLQGTIHHHNFFQKLFKEGRDFPTHWLGHCLMTACIQGYEKIVRLVLNYDVSFEFVRHEVGQYYSYDNPIELALHYGHMDVVKLLAREKRSMAECRRLGPTLLRAAVNRSDAVMLAAVVKHDVSIDHRYSDGMRPIHLACQRGTQECINILVKAGANLDVVDDEGITARQHMMKGYLSGCSQVSLNVMGRA
ncbi:MAG: hypothetical protein Q9225_005108 [Loekoesia sp. 1 TL-2023]